MKVLYKTLGVFIVLFMYSFFAQGQQADTAKINLVKAQYTKINNNLKSYKKIIKTDTAETTEGNEVAEFSRGKEIKKLQVIYYGETGKALCEFYFYDKKLIFYYNAEYRYNVSIYVDKGSVKVASIKEKRYYFNDGRIFMVKTNPKETISSSEFAQLSISTQKEASRLLNLKTND